MQMAGKVLVGAASLNAWSSLSDATGLPGVAQSPQPEKTETDSTEKLRIATCQFPVSGSPAENAKYVHDFMHKAAAQGAHLLHTSEASLSGYPGKRPPIIRKL